MKRTVSVIVPVHNGERTLRRSLMSVVTQEGMGEYDSALEIICVLNCCTDNSEEVIYDVDNYIQANEELRRKSLTLRMISCEEKGIVPALNTGLADASYNIIARQDADDLWYPTKLKKQLEFLEQNPDVSIVGTQIRLVDSVAFNPTGQVSNNPLTDEDIKRSLFGAVNPIAHPSVVFRKNIMLRAGVYDDLYPLCEDMHLWLKASRWYKMANLPEILVDYTSTRNPNYTPVSPQLATHNMKLVMQYFGDKK